MTGEDLPYYYMSKNNLLKGAPKGIPRYLKEYTYYII
jgi:hypothetical protein